MVAPIGGFGSGMAGLGALGGAEKADGAGAAGEAGAPGAAGGQDLQKALEELQKLMEMLMEILKNMGFAPPEAKAAPVGGAPAAQAAKSGGGGGGGGVDGFDGGAGGAGGAGAAAAGPATPTGPMVDVQGIKVDPALAPAFQQIAQHPDGAKLLEAAKANGLTSINVNTNLNPNGGAGTEGLFKPDTKSIDIANPNSPNLIHVLAHELGHAATAGDGDSQLEEKTVDQLGEKIHRDITGSASSFNLDVGSYSNLNQSNNILGSLRNLGIRV